MKGKEKLALNIVWEKEISNYYLIGKA